MGRKPSNRVKLYLEKQERLEKVSKYVAKPPKKALKKDKPLPKAILMSVRREEARKSYAPPVEEILQEAGLKLFPRKRRKRRFKKKFSSPEDYKEAFVRPHPYNNTIILINPNCKKAGNMSDRRWRPFSLNEGYIAKCALCGAKISSGFKSREDYICGDCRYRFFSHHSVWTISK